jgi:hypothetical protein
MRTLPQTNPTADPENADSDAEDGNCAANGAEEA